MNAAIDLGNSRLKVLRSDGRYSVCSLDTLDWAELETVLAPVRQVVLSSVNPRFEPTLRQFLGERWTAYSAQELLRRQTLPITIAAEGVGTDRVLGVLGALRYAEPPLVVVDFGTAMTATLLDRERRLIGGFILPGVTLQLQALQQKFPHLPVPEQLARWQHKPGATTADAIVAGLGLWVEAMIRAVYTAATMCFTTEHVAVCVTGGIAPMLAEMVARVDVPVRVVPKLVAEGALTLLEEAV